MSDSMHRNTPSVTVHDGRGLTVRQVTYYRAEAEEEAKPRITAQTYDCQGRTVAAWDPRLFERQSRDPDVPPQRRNPVQPYEHRIVQPPRGCR